MFLAILFPFQFSITFFQMLYSPFNTPRYLLNKLGFLLGIMPVAQSKLSADYAGQSAGIHNEFSV